MKQKRIHIIAVLLALSLAAAFVPAARAAGEVCQIGSTPYMTLDDALPAAADGDTIILLDDIDYSHGVSFVDKDITFDLNGHNLNIVNSSGNGLFANNSVIGIDTADGGSFNVTGTTRGVMATLGAKVTVTNATATSDSGAAVYSESGAAVTVQGDAIATGAGSIGAFTEGGSIAVWGDARGAECGAVSYGAGSSVTVGGNAVATGAGGIGAAAGDGGTITIDGEIQTTAIYIRIYSTDMEIGSVTLPTTKEGYSTYSGGSPISTVWVKMPTCEIVGGAQYVSLADALLDANNGDAVRLLADIVHNSGISIVSKTITLDLNGHDLDVIETSGAGLSVTYGGIVLTGSGSFDVTGFEYGVEANAGGVATVTSASATKNYDPGGFGISAVGGGKVTVTGDVRSDYVGIIAYGEETVVTVGGNVTVEANETWGIQASSSSMGGAKVDVGGNVEVTGGGILVQGNGSDIHVGGSVTATDGGGAEAMNGGDAVVDGNVTASAEGASALGAGSTVTVYGNLSGNIGVRALSGGKVEVHGDVGAVMLGAQAGYDGSRAVVHGAVIVSDDDRIGAEAYGSASGEAVVQIDGDIMANIYIRVGGDVKDGSEASRTIPTLLPGYHTYSSGGNIVYVKVPGAPVVETGAVTGVGSSGATFSGNVTDDGGLTVTERGFVCGTAGNPTIGDPGVIQVTAGGGTGEFSAELNSLTASTTYHVRAYATNEAGTSYGADRTFTTHSASLPPAPDFDSPPTVITGTVTGITASGAALSGRVNSSGGAAVTERGFVYGTSADPVIGGSGVAKVTAGGGLGEFTAEIAGLVPDTAYYVRAYAVNSAGAAYGANVNFTTALIPPDGETGELGASDIALTSGNVVLYTDPSGDEHILGLSIVEGSVMKYISRGPGDYEIIYNAKLFDDISGHWAKEDIDFSTARLLFIGVTPKLFSPDTAMTRGMLATVLGRMYGADPSLYTGYSFNDVPENAYYAPYVKWARENNILFGVSESSFEPERAVTRQEMAAMMHRFMKFLGLKLENGGEEFTDADAIDSWARESVMSLRETGILNGKPGNLFDPKASSTRAEITAVFRRLIEYIVNQ